MKKEMENSLVTTLHQIYTHKLVCTFTRHSMYCRDTIVAHRKLFVESIGSPLIFSRYSSSSSNNKQHDDNNKHTRNEVLTAYCTVCVCVCAFGVVCMCATDGVSEDYRMNVAHVEIHFNHFYVHIFSGFRRSLSLTQRSLGARHKSK